MALQQDGLTVLLSVIIPTFNRRQILEKVLDAIAGQSGVPLDQLEVVVVDDGSADGTQGFLREYAQRAAFPFQYACRESNGGPAKARNQALGMCAGDIVLMLGDDIVLAPDLLQRHMLWHGAHPAAEDAMLGYVTWPEAIHPTPFMRWLENGGRQYFFNYAAAPENKPLDPIFFYTCNISLKRSFLFQTTLFDESFPYASHEDLELGSRLQELGMRLFLDRRAVGYHWHPLDFKGIVRRIYLMGHSSTLFWNKARDRAPLWRKALRPVLREGAALLPVARLIRRLARQSKDNCRRTATPLRWHVFLALAYWRGVRDGRKNITADVFLNDAGLT